MQYKIFSLSAAAKQVLHMELLQYVIGCVFCETLSPQGTQGIPEKTYIR